ncbi:hypothetical protein DPMN_094430 [Dreissena polymorpha]|uniref:Uncharacterized protein n=1 Tax=Dreissena polymorpha TaxID=45954 RepID=A0A9D4L643_DREPO|nr:hypothetical protein DPMN_094430 [Dreissena polymorpha]
MEISTNKHNLRLTSPIYKFWHNIVRQRLEETGAYFLAFKQLGVIADLAELHDEVHERVCGRLGGGRGVGHGCVKKVLDGDLVLDALVEKALTRGQGAVYQHLNLEGKK